RFRTPHTGENGLRPEIVIPDVFSTTEPQEIVLTYDGATLLAAVKGRTPVTRVELNPGSSLAVTTSARAVAADHIGLYKHAYSVVLFAAASALVVAFGYGRWSATAGIFTWIVVFAGLLECTLVITSGRSFHVQNVFGSILLGTAVIPVFW